MKDTLTIPTKAEEVSITDVFKVIKGTSKAGKPYTMIVVDQNYRFKEEVADWLVEKLGLEVFNSKK